MSFIDARYAAEYNDRLNDFVIACGYEGFVIKEYFANYFLHMSDVTIDLASSTTMVHERRVKGRIR